jgi:hypothetical protein
MRSFLKVLVFFLISAGFFTALSADKLKARLAKAPVGKNTYIYIDRNTPDYIVKKAIKKRLGVAFFLKGNNAEWIAHKLPLFKNSSPIIFVNGELSELERGHLNELAKITDYRIKIYCFGDKCKGSVAWKHSLIKDYGTIYHKKTKKGSQIIFEKKEMKEKAKTASVTDTRDFLKTPTVSACLYFENLKTAFISLDSDVDSKFYKNAEFLIVYSSNEKKLNDFIEKNF